MTSARTEPRSATQDWRRQRAIRVFVSSTFTDMQGERDVLARRTFPELRARYEQHGATFAEVDLRWGITDEEAARGLVLSTCLAEIDQCRPFFVGIIGQRYGTVFVPSPDDRIAHPWLCERDRSLLELELCHAVSSPLHSPEHAVFLVQEPRQRQDPRLDRLIAALSARVELLGYRDLDQLDAIVRDRLGAVIDRAFATPGAPEDRLRDAHATYRTVRTTGEVRRRLRRVLDRQLTGSGPPLVIAGQPGAGKTTLLLGWLAAIEHGPGQPVRPARWWRRRRVAAPVLVFHAPAAAPWAPTWRDALGYLWRQLAPLARWPSAPPDDAEGLREGFAELVRSFPDHPRVVLVLDSPDQLEDGGALEWLPRAVAPSIRLVVSASPDAARELHGRGWRSVDLPPLTRDERRRAMAAYLEPFRKHLPNRLMERIVEAPGAGNPFYLRLLLNEARVFGFHEVLASHIERLRRQASLRELFGAILDRVEGDHAHHGVLVPKALGFIAASRFGLAEHELRDLLSAGERPVPWASWSTLRLALGDAVILQGGRIRLVNPQLADIVRARYLPGTVGVTAHRALAAYFRQDGVPLARKIDEVPEHLVATGDWGRLRDFFTDPVQLATAWSARSELVEQCWALIERHAAGTLRDCYGGWDAGADRPVDAAWAAASLLGRAGHSDLAIPIWERLLAHPGVVGAPRAVAGCLGNLAAALRGTGRQTEVKHVLVSQERCCRAANDAAGLQACLGNQALLAALVGDLEVADELHAQEARLCSELRMPGALGRALIHRARIRLVRSRREPAGSKALVEEALSYLDEGERSCRHAADRRGLLVAAGVRAGILRDRGKLRAAQRLCEDQARGFHALGDRRGFAMALSERAEIEMERLDFDAAFRDVELLGQLAHDAEDPLILAWKLYVEASLMLNLRQIGEARQAARDAVALCRIHGWDELGRSVADVLRQAGGTIA